MGPKTCFRTEGVYFNIDLCDDEHYFDISARINRLSSQVQWILAFTDVSRHVWVRIFPECPDHFIGTMNFLRFLIEDMQPEEMVTDERGTWNLWFSKNCLCLECIEQKGSIDIKKWLSKRSKCDNIGIQNEPSIKQHLLISDESVSVVIRAREFTRIGCLSEKRESLRVWIDWSNHAKLNSFQICVKCMQ